MTLLLAVLLLAVPLTGCTEGDGTERRPGSDPIGWAAQTDDETQVRFALPVPVSGPKETRRPGTGTAIASRSYGGRTGGLTLSVQFLSTPEDPAALRRELAPERTPFRVIDEVTAEGEFQAEILSNDRLEEMPDPTYDARLEVTSGDEVALWWMRTTTLEGAVLVTQVVAFVEGSDVERERTEIEAQGVAAFRRLTGTVDLP